MYDTYLLTFRPKVSAIFYTPIVVSSVQPTRVVSLISRLALWLPGFTAVTTVLYLLINTLGQAWRDQLYVTVQAVALHWSYGQLQHCSQMEETHSGQLSREMKVSCTPQWFVVVDIACHVMRYHYCRQIWAKRNNIHNRNAAHIEVRGTINCLNCDKHAHSHTIPRS